jgi:hypothetical protein
MINPVSARGAPVALSERYMKRVTRPARPSTLFAEWFGLDLIGCPIR